MSDLKKNFGLLSISVFVVAITILFMNFERTGIDGTLLALFAAAAVSGAVTWLVFGRPLVQRIAQSKKIRSGS